jgi:hypothetical protein
LQVGAYPLFALLHNSMVWVYDNFLYFPLVCIFIVSTLELWNCAHFLLHIYLGMQSHHPKVCVRSCIDDTKRSPLHSVMTIESSSFHNLVNTWDWVPFSFWQLWYTYAFITLWF